MSSGCSASTLMYQPYRPDLDLRAPRESHLREEEEVFRPQAGATLVQGCAVVIPKLEQGEWET